MLIALNILIVLVVTLGYITYNLLRKVEKQEDIIKEQDEYIKVIVEAIEYSNVRLKEVDEKGAFQGDDEIGWFFQNLKELQEALDQYGGIT
jgi:uncharacterized membrane protein YukC